VSSAGKSGVRYFVPGLTPEPISILIIDDTKGSREELRRIVDEMGHRTMLAESGMEGLRIATQQHPSLVLMDVEMPGFDGYKIAGVIKQLPRFIPVMLLTARSDVEAKRRAQAAGADDFLSKPVSGPELQIRIAAMLRIRSLTEQLDAANRRLAELADTDGLTAIANRRRFDQVLTVEHERAHRYNRPLSLAIVDIDFFKKINDTHGHAIGDVALKSVARALAETIRQSDCVARLGGEEFGVIAPEVGPAGGLALGERLRKRVEALSVEGEQGPFPVTISIGVVAWDGMQKIDSAGLLKLADDGLYQAKQSGRNRVILSVVRGE
jgi:diguanylate cyclase (GGDEF)-like protein